MCPDDDRPADVTEELERPRGILTKGDRELLAGYDEGLSERAKEQRVVRLRRRVRHGLMDALELLMLDPDDRQLIFGPRDPEEKRNVQGGASMFIRFLYMGLKETSDQDVRDIFQRQIKLAEEQLGEEQGEYRDPRVHLSIDMVGSFDLDELREKLDNEEDMTHREVSALINAAEKLTDEDWEKLRAVNEAAVDRELDKYSTGVHLRDLEAGEE